MLRARIVIVLALLAACSGGPAPVADSEGPHQLSNVAAQVGLDFRHGAFKWGPEADPAAMMGGGLCWLDYNSDGWMDLFVVNTYADAEVARWRDEGGLPTTALFRNQGGRFENVTAAADAGFAVRGSGCVAADFDLDGHVDLYLTTERDNLLLWNDGGGDFIEGADPAGVRAYGWHTGAAVGDINGDGWPDLFVAGYANMNAPNPDAQLGFPESVLGVRDLLFLNNGPGDGGRVTFREVGAEAGLEASTETGGYEYGLGAVIFDIDRDGDLDLYVANDTNPNRLYQNEPWPGGAEADPLGLGFRLEEIATSAGIADDNAGMGVAAGDYDGDGRPDLFVTNLGGQGHALFHNQTTVGTRPSYADERTVFAELAPHTGWGVTWADLDLDTDLDLFLVNGEVPVVNLRADAAPPQVFTQEGGWFTDRSTALGLDVVRRLHARGSAMADYDNDGDLDIAINSVATPLALLENSGVDGNWLQVALGGFHPGTVVEATLADGTRLVRDYLAGSSYLSSEDPRLHFGLGEVEVVPELVITWPGGAVLRLTDVEANQLLEVGVPGD